MSQFSAWFFGQVQQAGFYRELHAQAVALLPTGQGQAWFDVGCGAGLVATLAQARGYRATGFDPDAAMLHQARQRSSAHRAGEARTAPQFVQAGLSLDLATRHGQAPVVSAASLLRVLPDRAAALAQLCALVAPGGRLLLVETSALMASGQTLPGHPRPRASGRKPWVLPLWQLSRRGRPAVPVPALLPPGWQVDQHQPLLAGWVDAWLLAAR